MIHSLHGGVCFSLYLCSLKILSSDTKPLVTQVLHQLKYALVVYLMPGMYIRVFANKLTATRNTSVLSFLMNF